MMSILLIAACLIAILLMAGLTFGGIVWIMQSGERDAVSAAREEWINQGNEKDKKGY